MKIISVESLQNESAKKVLQLTFDNYVVETGVFDDGNTVHLCISSQIGCKIGCKMCYTGIKKSYHRNLTSDEIISQVENIINQFDLNERYDNIWFSFMGVGEPLLNVNNVISAIQYLNRKYDGSSFALATTLPRKKELNVLVEGMKNITNFKLTISLHSAIEAKRKQLIPTHTSLKVLREGMEYFKENTNHKYEWNYVLLKDFNDTDTDFVELLRFLKKDDRVKISTYNPIELGNFEKSDNIRNEILHRLLDERKIYNSKFDSVGEAINVGCGQMASKKLEKIRRN